ncbi:hypothetical protein [Paenibacillus sp. S150]|uniref:hypothetical protein n=1 Tax=Paenibacillus sp. S150 TaxID=2749826 RepID=UPI001C564FC2|nr:hypothetical protein [Paenibacillus sp. S150]MBW4083604.1 hypothetical protein [Paenibacillus sp. S150]
MTLTREEKTENDKIITLDVIRLERHKPRKCTCGDDKHFTVDKVNREITCDCGMTVDPFEAMLHLAEHYDYLNRQHESLSQQRLQWLKEKPHSVIFKKLEREYQRGKMLPYCPRCEQPFDYKNINSHVSAEYFRKWQERQQRT